MSAQEVDGVIDLGERLEAFEVLFHGGAGNVPGTAGLLSEARRTLVSEALYTAALELDRGLPYPELVTAYREFARSAEPGIEGSNEWARLTARLNSQTANPRRVSALARRIRGRLRSELNWYQWRRNGVF
jgi:hypothetical protein